jgi:hypothetical protein
LQHTGELVVGRSGSDKCVGMKADTPSVGTCGVRCAKAMSNGKPADEIGFSEVIVCTYSDGDASTNTVCVYNVRLRQQLLPTLRQC